MPRDYCLSRRQDVCRKAVSFSGSVHPAALFALFAFFLSGIFYLHALNRGAVQGYETRTLEKEITELKKENGKLKISEAKALSLSRIEESAKSRGMNQAESVRMVEGRSSLAFR
jgi:cell division protein FtsL